MCGYPFLLRQFHKFIILGTGIKDDTFWMKGKNIIVVFLLVLWILGMVSSYTLGGFIHVLLVLAIAVVLIRVIQGRRPI